jgi:hypothetical protein
VSQTCGTGPSCAKWNWKQWQFAETKKLSSQATEKVRSLKVKLQNCSKFFCSSRLCEGFCFVEIAWKVTGFSNYVFVQKTVYQNPPRICSKWKYGSYPYLCS